MCDHTYIHVHLVRKSRFSNRMGLFRSPGALTFGYGCAVHVGVDVGAGDIGVDVIYITFIMSAQYTGYLVLYKNKVNRTTGQLK